MILTASEDRTMRLWDAASTELKACCDRHGAEVNAAVFSRDCTKIATASKDRTARVFDVKATLVASRPRKSLLRKPREKGVDPFPDEPAWVDDGAAVSEGGSDDDD